MGFLLVVKAEVVRSFIIMRRYWFATLTAMFVGYGMLMVLIYGFVSNRDQLSDTMTGRFGDPELAINWALGFIIGMFAFGIVGIFTQGLQGMARTGELEQLCLSPHGLVTNFLGRSLVAAVNSVLSSTIMLTLIALTVDGVLHVAPLSTAILLVLTYANLIGFGFMVGGLVLVFKQVGQIAMLLRLALFGLAVGASDRIDQWHVVLRTIAHAMPITDAAICLKYVLVQGQLQASVIADGAKEFVPVYYLPSFYLLLVSCVFWSIIGIACFRYLETWSRDRGTLGSY